MERRGWIVALGAVALIGIGIYIWWSDSSQDGHASASAFEGGEGGSASHAGGGGGASATDEQGRPIASSRRFRGDGGVDHVGPRTEYAEPGSVQPSGVPTSRGIPRNAGDENHSAGWRLGQARVRMEILEGLAQRYQTAYDGFVADGNTESATRQRATLDRVTTRLAGMRELEAELLEQAQADGTMDEVEAGYAEGEPGNVRTGGAQGTVGTR